MRKLEKIRKQGNFLIKKVYTVNPSSAIIVSVGSITDVMVSEVD